MIERFEDEYGIRYRLDGRLHRANGPAKMRENGWASVLWTAKQ